MDISNKCDDIILIKFSTFLILLKENTRFATRQQKANLRTAGSIL